MEQSKLQYKPNYDSRGTRTTNRSQTLGDSTIGFTGGDVIPLQTRMGTNDSFAVSNEFKVKDEEGAVNLDIITVTRTEFESRRDAL